MFSLAFAGAGRCGKLCTACSLRSSQTKAEMSIISTKQQTTQQPVGQRERLQDPVAYGS